MKFSEFQSYRQKLLRERVGVVDCAATNLYAALAHIIPPFSAPPRHTMHRCHLAAEWVERFGLPSETSRQALISCGVRDSLALLFRHYAHTGASLWLPSDHYPVYAWLARDADLKVHEFSTLPAPVWPESEAAGEGDLLLVTNPLKPLGRWLTDGDVATLTKWLAVHPRRRLLVDAVYTFEERFHPTTLKLLSTLRTILLHSLTKGWLHPRLFGIALVPEIDAGYLLPIFRANPPPQANLAGARELMAKHPRLPRQISLRLAEAKSRLLFAMPTDAGPLTDVDAPGYFLPVEGRWLDILARANVLGLPAGVFGSPCENITILSSLSFLT